MHFLLLVSQRANLLQTNSCDETVTPKDVIVLRKALSIMSGTGVNYQDLLPIPEKTNAVDDPYQYEKSHGLNDGKTASHALATNSATEEEYGKGLAQVDHGLEVNDLGWNEPKQVIPSPLVGGMENEELWLLVRRFNKVSRASWVSVIQALTLCSKCTTSKRRLLLCRAIWI